MILVIYRNMVTTAGPKLFTLVIICINPIDLSRYVSAQVYFYWRYNYDNNYNYYDNDGDDDDDNDYNDNDDDDDDDDGDNYEDGE